MRMLVKLKIEFTIATHSSKKTAMKKRKYRLHLLRNSCPISLSIRTISFKKLDFSVPPAKDS